MSAIKERCLKLLQYPDIASLSIDSPETTISRWEIIREKPPLRQIYDEWYAAIASLIPPGDKPVLELGSGAGFMASYVDNLITSDILELPGVDRLIDACAALPRYPSRVKEGLCERSAIHMHFLIRDPVDRYIEQSRRKCTGDRSGGEKDAPDCV